MLSLEGNTMRRLLTIWIVFASIVTIYQSIQYIRWEMREAVVPDPNAISARMNYCLSGRNTETAFQHTFSTELTGDSDLLRITEPAIGPIPELSIDYVGNVHVTGLLTELQSKPEVREAFTLLCQAASDWKTGFRDPDFDQWVEDSIDSGQGPMFHSDRITAFWNAKADVVRVLILPN
jgi:hypothetical protein